MAKTDYAYAKRQKEIAKRLKKEEKKKLKAEAQPALAEDEGSDIQTE
jgi:hypothetical protein